MNPVRTTTALCLGLVAIPLEFQAYSSISPFFFIGPILYVCFLILIGIIAIVYFRKDLKHYKITKKRFSFTPTFLCITILAIVFGHMYFRHRMESSKTAFHIRNTEKIMGIENLDIALKQNGYVIGSASFKFSDDYFWGSYKRINDTILLDIKTDFTFGKIGIIKNDTIRFIGDTNIYTILPEISY